MLPPDWADLAPIIDAALDAPAERRQQILSDASDGDGERLARLQQILSECERDTAFLNRPAVEKFASLLEDTPGIVLPEFLGGRYRIEREIGRGGMACVYLAQDEKHSRRVAVKVIRPDLAASLGHDRFLREIGIAARLRHPNIMPLYDSGDADGLLYFVMPYEEGESLRTRLSGSVPLDSADRINTLRDIARALAYAHEQGIVHRDVKPDNVLLSGGAAVVTDFGIAKAVSVAQGTASGTTLTNAGAGIGTPAYMAPEQALGDPSTDQRADIYSFGCLAYELFTGNPPFHDMSAHQLIGAHVATPPKPIAEAAGDVPARVAALIMQCLAKNPDDRPQTARELLTRLESDATDTFARPEVVQSPLRRRVTAGTAILLALALSAAGAYKFLKPVLPLSLGASAPLTTDEGLQVETDISPNGRLIAYAKGNSSQLRIFVQKIGGGTAWPLSPDSNTIQLMPRWSPDNDQVLFLANDNAYTAPALGGPRKLIARGSAGNGTIHSAAWSPGGDSIVIERNDSLLVKPLEGTGSRFIAQGYQLHSCVWSPTGEWIACVSGNALALKPGPLFGNQAPSSIVLFPASGGQPVDFTGNGFENTSPAWSADGKFLWLLSNRDGVSGEAYATRVGRSGKAAGPAVRIGLKAESISMSASRIAYSVPNQVSNIYAVPIPNTGPVGMEGASQITAGNQVIELVNISRDKRWLAFDSNVRGDADIYRMPVTGGQQERVTSDPRPEYAAELSPDNSEIVWQRWVNGERHLFVRKLDSETEREMIPQPGDQGSPRWSPDGSAVAAWSHSSENGSLFVVKRNPGNGGYKIAWRLENAELPIWSPDGRTIAFVRLNGSVQTIPADSGTVTTVYAPRPGSNDPHATFLDWSRDPNVLRMIGSDAAGRGGIWELSLRSGRVRMLVSLNLPPGKAYGPTLASDATRFFFTLSEKFANVRWAELKKN